MNEISARTNLVAGSYLNVVHRNDTWEKAAYGRVNNDYEKVC